MNLILRSSLVLNAVLLVIAMARLLSSRPNPIPTTTPARPDAVTAPFVPNAEPPTQVPGVANTRKGWDWVESSDPRRLIANLREVGCPEETIQDMVWLRLVRAMRQRLLEQTGQQQRSVPYWKAPSAEQTRAQFSLRRSLLDEAAETLEGLFGGDELAIRMRVAGLPQREQPYAYLSPEKALAVRQITRRFTALEEELRDSNVPGGFMDPDSRARQKALELDKLVAISQVLTPAEYDLYLYRSSSTADYVRRTLPEAQSEEDFKRMVKVALEFEKGHLDASLGVRYALQDPDGPATKAQKEEEQAFRQRLGEELGGNRLAEQEELEASRERQQREAEGRARSIAEITEIGATEEEAGKLLDRLMALQPKMDARAKEMLPENPAPEQRQAFEAVIKAELEQAATEIMGEAKAKKLIKKFEREARR